jgi:hypothetical protein
MLTAPFAPATLPRERIARLVALAIIEVAAIGWEDCARRLGRWRRPNGR